MLIAFSRSMIAASGRARSTKSGDHAGPFRLELVGGSGAGVEVDETAAPMIEIRGMIDEVDASPPSLPGLTRQSILCEEDDHQNSGVPDSAL